MGNSPDWTAGALRPFYAWGHPKMSAVQWLVPPQGFRSSFRTQDCSCCIFNSEQLHIFGGTVEVSMTIHFPSYAHIDYTGHGEAEQCRLCGDSQSHSVCIGQDESVQARSNTEWAALYCCLWLMHIAHWNLGPVRKSYPQWCWQEINSFYPEDVLGSGR